MKITEEFISRIHEGRNLQSCITNAGILARCVQEVQQAIDEIKQKVGLPRGNDNDDE